MDDKEHEDDEDVVVESKIARHSDFANKSCPVL